MQSDPHNWLKTIRNTVLQGFSHELQHCVSCQQVSPQLVCDICLSSVQHFNKGFDNYENNQSFINTRPDVAKRLPKLNDHRLTAIGPHSGLLMDLINQFKYGKKQILAACLASILKEKILCNYAEQPLPEMLIPVPMHPIKRLFRGFNQTEVLSQYLVSDLNMVLSANILVRARYANPQAGKSGRQRRLLSQHLFKVREQDAVRSMSHIALLDDVITTGTTMQLIINTLKQVNPELRIDLWSLSVSL